MTRLLLRKWLLLPNRSLKLLLLRSTDDRRLFRKDLLQKLQELRDASAIPHFTPISQIWVIDSTINSHMLSGSYDHIFARRYIRERCFLWVCLGYP